MPEQMKSRNEIQEQDTWRLSDIFKNTEEWEIALKNLAEPLQKLISMKDRVGESAVLLANVLDLDQQCSMQMMELYAYAKMNKDLDNADPVYQAMYDRIVGEYFNLAAQTSFLEPAISHVDEDTLRQWMAEEAGLETYRHYLDNLIRNKPHILSEREETLLSQAGPMTDGIDEAYSMLNDLELQFEDVILENNEKAKLTHGTFGIFREDRNRNVRAQAYEKMHTAYKSLGNTIAALYTANVKGDIFFTKARGFSSCLERALFSDRLPQEIYTSLISSVHERFPSFYRYLALRKKQLGLEDLHLYDCSVPIVETPDKDYGFEEAKGILRKGLIPLGAQYLRDTENLFSDRAIDVYETPGKTSGAYAWGTYNSHSYMLLNWSGRLNDVFTFAHETGHCMHSYYSDKNQDYVNSHYPIFLAEIASTVNENVLLRYLIGECDVSTPDGRREKAYLLNYFLEGVKNTVFRQTMFAEFEWMVHQKIEQGEAVTSKTLCDMYAGLLRDYFGNDVVVDEYMHWEWARIPHFYSAFYVYKYATGFCAASRITEQLFTQGEEARTRYLEFLSAGGKNYPADTLGLMGIDMTSPDAVMSTMDEFDRDLGMLEELLNQI